MPDAVSVRQVNGLPTASFRSRLATDTLAFGYVLGATSCTRDLHPLERAHAERTRRKQLSLRLNYFRLRILAHLPGRGYARSTLLYGRLNRSLAVTKAGLFECCFHTNPR